MQELEVIVVEQDSNIANIIMSFLKCLDTMDSIQTKTSLFLKRYMNSMLLKRKNISKISKKEKRLKNQA